MIRRVILSRKGVDSAAGGRPSPILPDGRLFSLPIPQQPPSTHRYRDLCFDEFSAAELLRMGGGRALHPNRSCHFDPMLEGALGLLGQHGAAQGELSRHEVGVGDLFLFFGWFRGTEDRRGSGCHHLFGWLQVTEVVRGTQAIAAFLKASGVSHPHGLGDAQGYAQNTLYASRGRLQGPSRCRPRAAFGRFPRTHPELVLTEPGATRSVWRLPEPVFNPGVSPFRNRLHWLEEGTTRVQPRGFGQEFILDAAHCPGVARWALALIDRFGA